MAVKTLTVTVEAYTRLRAQKGPEESFSEVIVRLTARPPLASFAGTLSPTSARRLRIAVNEDRKIRARLDESNASRH
ncbi:MAG: antitoxin VapB family protein [Thermoplasmata archaeon]